MPRCSVFCSVHYISTLRPLYGHGAFRYLCILDTILTELQITTRSQILTFAVQLREFHHHLQQLRKHG